MRGPNLAGAWIIILVLLFSAGCDQAGKKGEEAENMRKWAEYTAQVDKTKSKMDKAEKQLIKLANIWNDMYYEKEGMLTEPVSLEDQADMDPFERLAFWTSMRLNNEENVGIIPMLDEIQDLSEQLVELQKTVNDISISFNQPYEVKYGDTHQQLAMEYLVTKHDISENEAIRLIRPAGLWDELEIGFLIYFYYDRERLHTSVHQGKAIISPVKFKRSLKEKRRLIYSAKVDSMLSIIEEKEGIKDSLDKRIEVLDVDIALKSGLIDSMAAINLKLQQQNIRKQAKVDSLKLARNSIFYGIYHSKELKKRDLYGGGFLFFGGAGIDAERAFKELDFESYIDIRETGKIIVNEKRKVILFSEQGVKLDRNQDYQQVMGEEGSEIQIINKEPYTGHKILIMVK